MLEHNITLVNCREDNTCESMFTSLIEVLKKELSVYRELKNTIIAEKMILIKPSLDELNHVNALKETIILKARILEGVRINILKRIARSLNIDESSIKLMSLASHAMIEQRQIVDDLKGELLSIAQEISEINDENKYLLNTSLLNVKGSLDLISSLIDRSDIYLGNGKISEVRKRGRLLQTEG
jgi:flagellar biosynthesis/type III secretory pathway chaperone